ncbi:hypothetical protein DV515_00019280, partial [Chloebia gouldiae]
MESHLESHLGYLDGAGIPGIGAFARQVCVGVGSGVIPGGIPGEFVAQFKFTVLTPGPGRAVAHPRSWQVDSSGSVPQVLAGANPRVPAGEFVAQFKFTLLLMPNGPMRITSGPFQPELYRSHLDVQDGELK